jgi:hypothetical protein
MSYEDYRRCGAIICKHVSDGQHPILMATRGTQLQPEDSGWQFLCGTFGHDASDAALWLLEEVAQLDPSLLPILDAEPESSFRRSSINDPWRSVAYTAA